MNIKNNLILLFLFSALYTPVTYTVRYKTAAIAKMTQQALINLIQTGKTIEIDGTDEAADIQRARILNLKLELERQRNGGGMGSRAGAGTGSSMGGDGTRGSMGSGTGAGAGMAGELGGTGTGMESGTGNGMSGAEKVTSEEDTTTQDTEKTKKEPTVVIKKAQFIKPGNSSSSNDASDACIINALKEIALEVYVGVSKLSNMKILTGLNGLQTGSSSYLYYIKDIFANLAGMNPEFKNQAALAAFIGDNETEPGYIIFKDGVNTNTAGELDTFCENRLSIAKVGLQNIHDNFATISDAFRVEIKKLLFNTALADDHKTYIDLIVANIAVSQRPTVSIKTLGYAEKYNSDAQAFLMMNDFIQNIPEANTITSEIGKNALNILRDKINLLRLDPQFMKYEELLGSKPLNAANNEPANSAKKAWMYPFLLALMDIKALTPTPKTAIQMCNFQLLITDPTFFINPGLEEDGIANYTEKMTVIFESILPKISMQQRIENAISSINDNLKALKKASESATSAIQKTKANQKYEGAALKIISSMVTKLKTPLFEAIRKLPTNNEKLLESHNTLEKNLMAYDDSNRDTLVQTLEDLSLDLAGNKKGLSNEARNTLNEILDIYNAAKESASLTKEPILALLRAIKEASASRGKAPVDDVVSVKLGELVQLSPENKTKIDRVWSSIDRNATEIAPLFVTKAVSLDEIEKIVPKKDWYAITNSYGLLPKIFSETVNAYANEPRLTPLIDSLQAIETGKIDTSGKEYVSIINDNKIKPLILSKIYINPATQIAPMVIALKNANILEFITLIKSYIKTANANIDVESARVITSIAEYLVKVYLKDVKIRLNQLAKGRSIEKEYAIPTLSVAKLVDTQNKNVYEKVKDDFKTFNSLVPDHTLDVSAIMQKIDIEALKKEKDLIIENITTKSDKDKATLFGNYLENLIEKLEKIKNAESLFVSTPAAGGPNGTPPPPPPPPPPF